MAYNCFFHQHGLAKLLIGELSIERRFIHITVLDQIMPMFHLGQLAMQKPLKPIKEESWLIDQRKKLVESIRPLIAPTSGWISIRLKSPRARRYRTIIRRKNRRNVERLSFVMNVELIEIAGCKKPSHNVAKAMNESMKEEIPTEYGNGNGVCAWQMFCAIYGTFDSNISRAGKDKTRLKM